ncbi:hypothetical protein IRJ41_006087 [Triplophysa rosa]|uniref:Uncharacterized protein n=1 Tax=Triplophysa rosa TaxID=992332 RepID=A0A9W7WVJ6_TRIRA|nr:hypothetical protein IRJ41_006087 [Triplophysa rosa]
MIDRENWLEREREAGTVRARAPEADNRNCQVWWSAQVSRAFRKPSQGMIHSDLIGLLVGCMFCRRSPSSRGRVFVR